MDTGQKFLGFLVISDRYQDTGNNFIAGVVDCCDDRGLFFLQDSEPLGKNKDAALKNSNISGAGVGHIRQ